METAWPIKTEAIGFKTHELICVIFGALRRCTALNTICFILLILCSSIYYKFTSVGE